MVRTVHPDIRLCAEPSADWQQLITSFRRALHAENRAPGTIANYCRTTREFATWLAEHQLEVAPADVGREHVQAYISWLLERLKASTVVTRYAEIHAFFSWLVAEDELAAHPMRRMHRPSTQPEPGAVLSEDAIRALLQACAGKDFESRRDTAIIRLLLDTGMRRAELAGIRLADLDLDEQEVKVLGKGRRPRIAAFGAKATKALDSYLRVRPRHPKASDEHLFLGRQGAYGHTGIREMLLRRAAQAGLEIDIYPHLFRHTFADQSIARGKSESYVMEQGGWKSETIMRRYGAANRARRARRSFKQESIGDAF
jgi:site-specific recombinase XerD